MKKILLFSSILLLIASISFIKLRPIIKEKVNTIETEKIISRPNPSVAPTPVLPSYFLNKTTFIPQAPEKNWDQPWQDACEEAAILTVHYYLQNLNPSPESILADYRTLFSQSSTHDQNLSEMADIATNTYGYTSKIIADPTINDIKKYLIEGQIVIVPANGKTLYQENKHFKSGGPWYHNLVILGFDDTTNKFIVHDVGTQFGAYFQYSQTLLMKSIHDFPPDGNKENIDLGQKAVLLLVK